MLVFATLVCYASAFSLPPSIAETALGILSPGSGTRQAGPSAGSADLVYNLHIPKVAGVSFAADAEPIFRAGSLRSLSHEGCFSDRAGDPKLVGVTVLFRQPREHVLSQYEFCSGAHGNMHAYINAVRAHGEPRLPSTFEEWVHHWRRLQVQGWHGNFTPGAEPVGTSLEEASERKTRMQKWSEPPVEPEVIAVNPADWPRLNGGGTIFQSVNLPFNCYSPINLQSHRLSCGAPLNYPRPAVDIGLAISNMQSAWFVGIMEAYQTSICLLHAKVHTAMPAFCDCTDAQKWGSFTMNNTHETTDGRKLTDFRQDVLDEVDKLTSHDFKLYRASVERFAANVREAEAAYGTRILCDATAAALGL